MDRVIVPGFLSSPEVHTALLLSACVAAVTGIVGVFMVLRGQSFAGHALADVAAAGASGAFLAGLGQVAGFVGGALVGGGAMEAIGVQRVRGRDVATGVVLGASLGLTSLFLYLTTTSSASTGTPQQILFGDLFTVTTGTVVTVAVLGVAAIAILVLVNRPLLLMTVSPELAASRGIPLLAVGGAFMASLALAVALSSIAIGAILSTALLVGPAAAAVRLTNRLARAATLAVGLGILASWLGILLSYDSATWFANGNGLPVSFFIVSLVVLEYAFAGAVHTMRRRRGIRASRVA
jgi:zinc/manganese transport system permease protein